MLGGEAKRFLDEENDLVALKPAAELDYLSRLRDGTGTELTRDGRFKIGRFQERSISLAISAITVFVAAILLIGSITGFYFVNSDAAKLTMIATFTVAFALSVGLLPLRRKRDPLQP
ncbi:hypothetical protein GQ53DRAFT_822763 [Thozetella sp. PMI_491]|nr:hypothetical protein GQ53DRAFT_822763 [Thozetella sp. PMI_491]